MSCLLYVKDKEADTKIDINELYEKENKRNQRLLSCFSKILNRIHKKIQLIAKNNKNDHHIFFQVPEFILGEPLYDKAHCVAFLFTELESNQFLVKYLHPNILFVSWKNFIPDYIREQLKKNTGVSIDHKGNLIPTPEIEQEIQQKQEQENRKKESKDLGKYKSTEQYKPTGNFVYNSDLFDSIGRKCT